MRWVHGIRAWLRLLARGAAEERMEEEIRFHLDMETEKNVRAGMAHTEARRRAVLAFGGVEGHKEQLRDERSAHWAESAWRDLRLGVRRLVREPSFSGPALVTVAIGVGATMAIFTLVHSVILQPLSYRDAERLVAIEHMAPGFGLAKGGISDGLFVHYREHSRVFEEIGVYHANEQNLTDGETPERVRLAMASPGVFAALGVAPHRGRLFTDADAEPDAPTVVMISHDLWVRRYGADPAIVGGTIETNGTPTPVVGVLPPAFDFPSPETQVWYASGAEARRAGVRNLYRSGIARLREGMTPEDAEADLQRLIATLPEAYPDVTPELLREAQFRALATPLHEARVAEIRPALVLLLCVAALVLLIAWANAANLTLLRTERQRREVAVARALGARGRDLAGRFLSESLVIAALAGVVGLAIAYAGVATRFGLEMGQIPRLHELRVGGVVIGTTLGLSCMTGLLLAVVPLLRTRHAGEGEELRGSSARTTDGRGVRGTQRVLLGVQIALALALLVGSAAMARSVWNLLRIELGFDPRDTLTLELPLPFGSYPRYTDAAEFQLELLERLRAVPGIVAAEGTLNLPLTPAPFVEVPLMAEGSASEGIPPMGTVNFATPGYFAAAGIPLLRGRAFRMDDLAGGAPPVVVSQALARALFGAEEPVGRRLRLPEERPDEHAYTVMGVVGDVPGESLTDGPARTMYLPIVHDPHAGERRNPPIPFIPREGSTILVRTRVPPLSVAATVRRIVRELDPELPIARMHTGEQIVAAATARARLMMLLLLLGTGAALALGVVGIYGTMSYWVGHRKPELGVRLALGARPSDISRMVITQAVRVILPGMIIGLVAALALTRLMRGLLVGVSPTDPAVFAGASALLFAIALTAAYIPARRARSIDPARTLRTE
jgi:putative ABC transport system permease protein